MGSFILPWSLPVPCATFSSASSRPWNPLITIEIRERFYRLQRTEERQDGPWWVHAYVLGEVPESEVIRYLIRYDPQW